MKNSSAGRGAWNGRRRPSGHKDQRLYKNQDYSSDLPTSALDPEMIKEVLDTMVGLAEEGMAAVSAIQMQYLEALLATADAAEPAAA